MKQNALKFLAVIQISLAPHVLAADLITDAMENDGAWTLGQSQTAYLPAIEGLTPTAGQAMMHFNSGGDCACFGTSFVNYSNRFSVGTYIARIDVGSFTNRPFSTIESLGLTAGGELLTPDSSSTNTPAPGEFTTWVLVYTNTSCAGKTIGFRISVPGTGEMRNVAFDNLRIEFIPDTNTVCASIHTASEVCWDSQPNKTYQVQWTDTLASPNWNNLGTPAPGTGTNICIFDSNRGRQQRFYRVQVLP